MNTNHKNILILDGMYHLFRFYHGIPKTATLPDGTCVNAVYGFFAYLRRLINVLTPDEIFVVFDAETGTSEKRKIVPTYKANRKCCDTGMFDQLPIIQSILRFTQIPVIEHPDFEADDVISTLAKMTSANARRVYVATNDHDFYQLVNNTIVIVRESRAIHILVTPKAVLKYCGISPSQYPAYLALKGDSSDNIKGIPGIGAVTAKRLLSKYHSLDMLFANLIHLSVPMRKKLIGNERRLMNMCQFLTMKTDIPLERRALLNGGRFLRQHLCGSTNDLLKAIGYRECFVKS